MGIFKAIGSALGSVSGGVTQGIAGSIPAFKGTNRDIDKRAYTIKDLDKYTADAKAQQDIASARSQDVAGVNKQLLTDLQARASGQAPSLANAQLKAASDRSLAQQVAAAQAQRGGSSASRNRNLAMNQAAGGRDLAQQSVAARLQEQQQAQSLLAQTAGQQQAQSDALVAQYLAQGFSMQQAQQAASAAYETLMTQQHLATQGLSAQGFFQQQQAAQQQAGEFFNQISGSSAMKNMSGMMGGGGGGGAGAGMAAMSDRRQKKNIKKTSLADKLMSMSDENKKINKAKVDTNSSNLGELRVSENESQKEETARQQENQDAGRKSVQVASTSTTGSAPAASPDKAAEIKTSETKGMSMPATHVSGETTEAKDKAFKGKNDDADFSFMGTGKNYVGAAGEGLFASASSSISDKNDKKHIDEFNPRSFLDALQAYSYEYKNPKLPGAGKGTYVSVMAQDLEKAGPVGKQAVIDTPHGKMVDYGKLAGAMLASQASLNQRLNEMERGYAKVLKAKKSLKKG